MHPLLESVRSLQKVGPKSEQDLNNMGIYQIADLLHYYPRDYEAVSAICPIAELVVDQTAYIKGQVISDISLNRFHRHVVLHFVLADNSGKIRLYFYNQLFLKKIIHTGDELIIKGKYSIKNNRRTMAGPKIIKPEEYEQLQQIKLKPIYSLSRNIRLKQLTHYVEQSLERMHHQIQDYLPDDVRQRYHLATLAFAYEKIHFPIDRQNLALATNRLVFDEFFLFQMAIQSLKKNVTRSRSDYRIRFDDSVKEFIEGLPFQLTQKQVQVVDEIQRDMSGSQVMTRLLQGNVGSGKTIVAIISLLAVAFSGYQSAFMVPTEVLAIQHYQTIKEMLAAYSLPIDLLTGSTSKKEKDRIYADIKTGKSLIVIGTHALIQEAVEFNDLGLVITDEQHRFGVLQREHLVNKGRYPHTLVMSATPIPRTLALILYGDLDISVIDQLPAGRKKIETYLVDSKYQGRLLRFIEKEVDKGRNVYVVCSLIEHDAEKKQNQTLRQSQDLKSVEQFYDVLREALPERIQIGKLHGKMKSAEKNQAIQDFLDYKTQVLVSTTVIEVGVNVKNASLMIVLDADRFGLAQLHQLRGRVGRSQYQSYCVFVSDTKNKETRKKLEFLAAHEDGFELAEYDLQHRGPGDAFGTVQHGDLLFKIANIYRDKLILEQAVALAKEYVPDQRLQQQLELFYHCVDQNIGL